MISTVCSATILGTIGSTVRHEPKLVHAAGTARAGRRVTKMQRKVSAWWETLASEARRAHYTGAQIADAVGLPITSLGPGLLALGWRREVVRLNVDQVGLWLPPGAPSIKRPVGRPSIAQLIRGITA